MVDGAQANATVLRSRPKSPSVRLQRYFGRDYKIAYLFVLPMVLLMAGLSVRMVWDHYTYDEISPGLGVPQWWYSMWLPILSLAIALRALGRFNRLRRAGSQP